ncbi:MAG: hypothetical protein CL947_04385 [Epsilonproteobacteria bacterium]|nr:hypothetical protein [Campylobacterota bacterium]
MSIKLRNEVCWHTQVPSEPECQKDCQVEVAVIGGGMTGLSAAQAFAKRGKKVALFERHCTGSGATGKSGGFITPNAELSLSDFEKHTNKKSAKEIWNFINRGLETIRETLVKNKFDCDYQNNPGLFVANCSRTIKNLQQEYENVINLGYDSTFYNQQDLQNIIGTDTYVGGMTYENSFGINPFKYCKALSQHLKDQGVEIFENTPVTNITNHTITTPKATITADYIVICVDRFLPDLGILQDYIYHVQNYVLASIPLTNEQIQKIFPQKQYMVWDSQLIYNYYRIIENNRFIIGGGDIFSAYTQEKYNYTYGQKKLMSYINNTFPDSNITFEYQWPGLIGVSKDIGPIAAPDTKYPHIYYIAGVAGLPVGATLGMYSAEHLLDKRTDMDQYFNPYRKYFIGTTVQKIIGKRLAFAINNFMSQNTVGCF